MKSSRVQNWSMEICIIMAMIKRLHFRTKPMSGPSRDKATDGRIRNLTQALTMIHTAHLLILHLHPHQQTHLKLHPLPLKIKTQISKIRTQIFKFKIILKFKIYKKIHFPNHPKV